MVVQKKDHQENNESQKEELVHQLRQLNIKIQKQLSWKHNLFIAIVRGVGYTIGATLVAGIIVSILAYTFSTVDQIPLEILNPPVQIQPE
ncbi:MAG TPA: hypothetical protein VJB65_02935 [Patescibacteria group bacterium]|nr:hypothetical protein [Patescibacteria group bacterium]